MRASSSINWRVYGTRDRQIKRLRLCRRRCYPGRRLQVHPLVRELVEQQPLRGSPGALQFARHDAVRHRPFCFLSSCRRRGALALAGRHLGMAGCRLLLCRTIG